MSNRKDLRGLNSPLIYCKKKKTKVCANEYCSSSNRNKMTKFFCENRGEYYLSLNVAIFL